MAIQTEVWARDIAGALFPADSFVMKAINDDPWVDNKVVHRANAGAVPSVSVNRAVYPAVAALRTDIDGNYNLDELTSDPTHIPDIEEIETNYDKRMSVLSTHINEINKQACNHLAYRWGATLVANIVRTTGGTTPANTPGATGNRKKLTLTDLMAAKQVLDDMDVPYEGRHILIPASMYKNLVIDFKTELMSADFRSEATIKDGVVQKIFGFNVYTRGKKNVLRYTNAGTPVRILPSTAGAATDNAAALCWHEDFLARAKGAVKIYSDIDAPGYYGSVFSAMARIGGNKVYTDETGVVSIVEAAG